MNSSSVLFTCDSLTLKHPKRQKNKHRQQIKNLFLFFFYPRIPRKMDIQENVRMKWFTNLFWPFFNWTHMTWCEQEVISAGSNAMKMPKFCQIRRKTRAAQSTESSDTYRRDVLTSHRETATDLNPPSTLWRSRKSTVSFCSRSLINKWLFDRSFDR